MAEKPFFNHACLEYCNWFNSEMVTATAEMSLCNSGGGECPLSIAHLEDYN
jgi:hypothetical protein